MKFKADNAKKISAGRYNFQFIANTDATPGVASLTFSISNGPFKPVKNGTFSADDNDIIEIGACRLRAGLTNDAAFIMSKTS